MLEKCEDCCVEDIKQVFLYVKPDPTHPTCGTKIIP